MNPTQDYYQILGVAADASDEEIRSAYRKLARRLHPDANSNPGAALQFRDIGAANQILSDSLSRGKYDRELRARGNEKPYFVLKITPSKRVLPIMSEPQVLYVMVEVLPEKSRTGQHAESNLNLTLVLDHSTSMKNNGRLERTKAAAHQIIDQLTDKDVLSVVEFSDKAEVLFPSAPVVEKPGIKARVTTMQAGGATEILKGLTAGFEENKRTASKKFVNHIILLTDGKTYFDEQGCIELADKAAKEGIGISAMGIGEDWNDAFLDQLAGHTGGVSQYINTPNAVVRFMTDHVRALGQAYAERVTLSLAPDADIQLEEGFRLSPNPQPMPVDVQPIPIGQLRRAVSTSIVFRLLLPPITAPTIRTIVRADITADIMRDQRLDYKLVGDMSLEVMQNPPQEDPPLGILEALGKLSLYKMQERAQEAVTRGDVQEATRRLENLATRLLQGGHEDLANATMAEAKRLSQTGSLSTDGEGQKKTIKYGTRLLIAGPNDSQNTNSAAT